MSAKRDYYEILGQRKGANAEELKKSYRKLAMQYHPDRNPGDKEAEQKFKEISEAYDILKDDQKRAAYDRYGHAAFDFGGSAAGGGRGGAAGGFDFSGGFSDIFEDLFGEFMGGNAGGAGGRGARQQQVNRGNDLRYNLEVSLEEAFKGEQKTIRVNAASTCDSCKGGGSADGAAPEACSYCQGSGKVRMQQGFFTIERTCTQCSGVGTVIKNPCKSCKGTGRLRKERTLNVNIPSGVDEGTRIRLTGEGESGVRGGPPGDLYIFVSVKQHMFFQREGQDIHCKVPVKMTTAALGGSIEVPTIDGTRAKLVIPSGAQTGNQFRLRGKGMTNVRSKGTRGDMYVQAVVETPVSLTKHQRELLQRFDEEAKAGSSPESESFFKKAKEMWGDLKD